MVNTNKIEMHILNFIFIIIFNIGMGVLSVKILTFSNIVFNLMWMLLEFFGNLLIINVEVGK